MDPIDLTGFDPRVQGQLARISQNQAGRRSSQSSLSSSSQASLSSQYNTHIHPRSSHYPRGQHAYLPRQLPPAPPGLDAFPPLGSAPPANAYNMSQQNYQSPQGSYPIQNTYQTPSAAQEFFSRSRGRGRGRGNRQPNNRMPQVSANDYARPAPQAQRLYVPSPNVLLGTPEQQRSSRQRHMEQTDYLNDLLTRSSRNMLSTEEIAQKQRFSQHLESIARQAVHFDTSPSHEMRRTQVKLQPYGSLANSFGTAGCDVDLLLTVQNQDGSFVDISDDIKRDLEKTLLDQGIGARLLTNTRVPILRICEKPNAELLKALREYRAKWELSLLAPEDPGAHQPQDDFGTLSSLTKCQEENQLAAMADLDLNAADVALPKSPMPDHAKLEYVGDCGIQCDINFSNHIALHNSRLLWTYGQCDARARHLGIFVKNWAKARDINTPYRGTLSSYGYILMVLHYLINVVKPPLLPNLQEMAKDNGWSQAPPELLEGHDIRFTRDPNVIRQEMSNMPRNNTSLGGLLLGFFRYYGTPQGFRWVEQVISLRTPGGILSKEQKGWTKAKWSEENSNVRQRYLLALEDPFEVDHNVGRTVGHNGIVAIRDEFRRAWDIIDTIQRVPTPQGPSWVWNVRGHDESGDGFDLLKASAGRGDTLRKDADARRARQMREKLELQHALAMKNGTKSEEEGELGEVGMLTERENHLKTQAPAVDDPAGLIHDVQHQDEKVAKMRSRQPDRQRHHEDDNEEDELLRDEAQSIGEAGVEKSPIEFERDDLKSDTGSLHSWGQVSGKIQEQAWNESGLVAEIAGVPPKPLTAVSQSEADTGGATNVREEEVAKQGYEPGAVPMVMKDNLNDATELAPPGLSKGEAADRWFGYCQDPTAAQPCHPDCVGEVIGWTTKSKAGLWLLSRDKKIREGKFKAPTASILGRLNAKFPYNKSMTRGELAQMNKRLEESYKDSYYPKVPVEPAGQSPEADKVFVDVTADVNSQGQSDGQFRETLQHVKPAAEWPVGPEILWSPNTDAGDWLRWRDRRAKEGKWKDDPADQSLSQRLGRLFPYNSERTVATIERMNTELDTFFADLKYPNANMDEDERRGAYIKMHQAIEKVVERRMAQLGDGQSCPPPVAPSSSEWPRVKAALNSEGNISNCGAEATDRKVQSAYAELQKQIYASATVPADSATPSSVRQATADIENKTIPVRWPVGNSVGSWLQQRDEGIADGTWQDMQDENSVFSRLNSLYPHDLTRPSFEQDRLRKEITTHFTGVRLPRSGFSSAEPLYRAILKVVEYRKIHAETKRVRFLLDMFQEKTMKDLEEARSKPVTALTLQQRQEMHQRSLQAVQAVSGQLSVSQLSPPTDEVADFVRKQRLAFFEKQQVSPSSEVVPDMTLNKDTEVSIRRDSAAEGSWSDLLSPSKSLHPCATPFVPVTDSAKPTGRTDPQSPTSSPRSGDSDPFEPKRQHDPATTDESAGELVPKTLQPITWRTNRMHRHEDPRIIPFPRTLDFPFDTRQLVDIENIKSGGNGCVRGGKSPYMLESDRHSWGGGGAMAQESEPMQWSWSQHGHMYSDSGVGMEDKVMTNVELLNQLPALRDLLAE